VQHIRYAHSSWELLLIGKPENWRLSVDSRLIGAPFADQAYDYVNHFVDSDMQKQK
jgi:hypothetical protein